MVLHGGYVYRIANRDFAPLDIWIEGSQIRGIAPHGSFDDRDTEHTDASGCWIVPGLIDVHTHGRVGFDFVSCATATPARQTGIYDSVGSIDIGKQADLLLLKNPERLIPEKILLRGK
jgi:imidazolonepropionase-like amidohydrolase